MDWASRAVRGKARELNTVRTDLTHSIGREPTRTEIAGAMGMSMSELAGLESDVHRAGLVSLQALPSEDGAAAVPSTDDQPEEMLIKREQIGYLHDAVVELPAKLRLVIEQHFFGQRRMADIAVELGVTESRVSQLRSEALVHAACRDEQRRPPDRPGCRRTRPRGRRPPGLHRRRRRPARTWPTGCRRRRCSASRAVPRRSSASPTERASRSANAASQRGARPDQLTGMDVLVIGGTVFLGRAVVSEALAAGHTVTVFNRARSASAPHDVRQLVGDRTSRADLEQLRGRRFDLVIDTCGYVPADVGAGAELLAPTCGHYAFVSSVNAYPRWPEHLDYADHPHDGNPDATRDDLPGSLDPAEAYGWLKVGCERAVERAFGADRTTVLRAGAIVGPQDSSVGGCRGGSTASPGAARSSSPARPTPRSR